MRTPTRLSTSRRARPGVRPLLPVLRQVPPHEVCQGLVRVRRWEHRALVQVPRRHGRLRAGVPQLQLHASKECEEEKDMMCDKVVLACTNCEKVGRQSHDCALPRKINRNSCKKCCTSTSNMTTAKIDLPEKRAGWKKTISRTTA